jgi:hypothetical protein
VCRLAIPQASVKRLSPCCSMKRGTNRSTRIVSAARIPPRLASHSPKSRAAAAPREQLLSRQSMTTRRRRHQPRPRRALRHDSMLLRRRPTPARTRRDHLQPRHRHRRMFSHTPMSSAIPPSPQGGLHRTRTLRQTLSQLIQLLPHGWPFLHCALCASPAKKRSAMVKTSRTREFWHAPIVGRNSQRFLIRS